MSLNEATDLPLTSMVSKDSICAKHLSKERFITYCRAAVESLVTIASLFTLKSLHSFRKLTDSTEHQVTPADQTLLFHL